MSDAAVNPLKAGLEDVVVSPSEICFIDGHKGRLVYRGFDVDDLPSHEVEARGRDARVKARSATRAVDLAKLNSPRTPALA